MDFKQEIIKLLAKETKLKKEELANLISVPPDPKLGDYAFPCFKLGQPKEAAIKLKKKIKLPKFLSKIEVVGPYLNFFVKQAVLAEEILKTVFKKKKKYGSRKKKGSVVVEYPAPNTNKPLHLGHLRNISLGKSVSLILRFLDYNVHEVDLLNDRGIHICKSMLAYKKWGKNKKPTKKTDHFVGDYYVLFSKKAKENPDLEKEAAELLLKWEQGDKGTVALWKKMDKWAVDGFNETFRRFGIEFEKVYPESKLYQHGRDIILKGLKQGKFKRSVTGEIYAELEQYGLPDKILLRADGTSIYMTQDLYLAQKKYEDFKFDKSIYVVGSEQNLHFKQLFKILELLKKSYAKNCYHLSYGLVHLPSGRMKSREGTVVDADDIMDETAEFAKKEIKKRHKNLSKEEIKKRAELISLGAIKFYMLKTDSIRDVVFNPQESLSFEGETGPYIQYAHARCASILKKAKQKINTKVHFESLSNEYEKKVILHLSKFPETVLVAAEQYKPYLVAKYLLDLAQYFNEFYHNCPVISDLTEVMHARLLLVTGVKQVLANGLNLLGIEAPEEM